LTLKIMETLMTEAQNIETADLGQLTHRERMVLERQVMEEAQAREARLLKQAREDGFSDGVQAGFSDGERRALLDIVAKFAPEALDAVAGASDPRTLRAAVDSALVRRLGDA
jgi:flagellar biosynthesis/type III secretory pathway protein FliH